VQAAHILRLDAQEDRDRRPRPELEPLRSALDETLTTVEARLRALPDEPPAPGPPPDLRGLYRDAQRRWGRDPDALALLAELDELVDAANGLAAAAGMAPDDPDEGGARAPSASARISAHDHLP